MSWIRRAPPAQHARSASPTVLSAGCNLLRDCCSTTHEQGSAALGGCPAESGGRGPAIRYALPLRPPERSRGITGRPALRPLGAGAAHLAAAAPKRARRPGALHAGCGELSAKPLPLRGATVSGWGTSEF